MAITNKALSLIFIGLVLFTNTAKSKDLAFKQKKINTKTLAKDLTHWPVNTLLAIAETLISLTLCLNEHI